MSVTRNEINNKLAVNDVKVVQEHSEVFWEELPGTLPEREVSSLLITSIFAPISRTLYRMAPNEYKNRRIVRKKDYSTKRFAMGSIGAIC